MKRFVWGRLFIPSLLASLPANRILCHQISICQFAISGTQATSRLSTAAISSPRSFRQNCAIDNGPFSFVAIPRPSLRYF
uniref:Putative secreted protein n=1 Tax=Anopheles triannulatus TaxID=58253 RepID=A0A2M4B7W7_9DIPT